MLGLLFTVVPELCLKYAVEIQTNFQYHMLCVLPWELGKHFSFARKEENVETVKYAVCFCKFRVDTVIVIVESQKLIQYSIKTNEYMY